MKQTEIEKWESALEEAAQKNYELGKVEALKDIANQFKIQCGKEFAVGNDKMAQEYRSLAKNLMDRYEKDRKAYDKKWPHFDQGE